MTKLGIEMLSKMYGTNRSGQEYKMSSSKRVIFIPHMDNEKSNVDIIGYSSSESISLFVRFLTIKHFHNQNNEIKAILIKTPSTPYFHSLKNFHKYKHNSLRV